MLMQPSFFYGKPSILPKQALAKFYLSTTFGLSFILSSVTPTRSLTSYAYLITKIGNRDYKPGFHWANYDHDNDKFRVKTKRLGLSMTAQPYNHFVFVSWSWHLLCNGNQALGHMVVNTVRLAASQFSNINRPIFF